MHGIVHTDAKHNTQGSSYHSMTVFSFRFPWDKSTETTPEVPRSRGSRSA